MRREFLVQQNRMNRMNYFRSFVAAFYRINRIFSKVSMPLPWAKKPRDQVAPAAYDLFPAADPTCLECAHPCPEFPPSIQDSIDHKDVLYGTVRDYGPHILVATGKSNWPHTIEEEKGSMANALSKANEASSTASKRRHLIKISNCSISPPHEFHTDDENKPTDLLLVSSFIRVNGVPQRQAQEFVDSFVHGMDVPTSLTSIKMQYDAVVLLCSHKQRDKRCGVTAPILRAEFERHLRQQHLFRDAHDSRPGGVLVQYINHVGGHKYSGNVLIYRREPRECMWLGRVEPRHVEGIVAQSVLQGRAFPQLLRGGYSATKTSW